MLNVLKADKIWKLDMAYNGIDGGMLKLSEGRGRGCGSGCVDSSCDGIGGISWIGGSGGILGNVGILENVGSDGLAQLGTMLLRDGNVGTDDNVVGNVVRSYEIDCFCGLGLVLFRLRGFFCLLQE